MTHTCDILVAMIVLTQTQCLFLACFMQTPMKRVAFPLSMMGAFQGKEDLSYLTRFASFT